MALMILLSKASKYCRLANLKKTPLPWERRQTTCQHLSAGALTWWPKLVAIRD